MIKIPQNEPLYDDDEIDAVRDYLDQEPKPWLMEYKQTRKFEETLSNYVGSPYCSVMDNGTNALLASLIGIGIKPKDEVIVPAFAHMSDAMTVSVLGAKPVLVDVEPDSIGLSHDCVMKALSKKTKAIMMVSINGRAPKDWLDILAICERKRIPIIEDACQSLGSYFNVQKLKTHIGTLGLIGCFSFSMPKIISSGSGGAIITHDKELMKKINMIKDFGRPYGGVDQADVIGLNFKYNDVLSTILNVQFKKLPARVARKKQIYKLYRELLGENDKIKFLETDLKYTCPWMVDIILSSKKERDNLIFNLARIGVGSRPFYPALHMQKPYMNNGGDFPYAKQISDYGLWLPSSLKLKDEEIEYICDNVLRIVKEEKK